MSNGRVVGSRLSRSSRVEETGLRNQWEWSRNARVQTLEYSVWYRVELMLPTINLAGRLS